MIKNVLYRKNNDAYYKIDKKRKSIVKVEKNVVSYIEYSSLEEILTYKSIKMNQWKHIENSFFISKDFEWEYKGKKYRTCDKPIKWKEVEGRFESEAMIFHNGKVWVANYPGSYYPRTYLQREVYNCPITRTVLVEKKESNLKDTREISKWTDIKYCRNFEEVK